MELGGRRRRRRRLKLLVVDGGRFGGLRSYEVDFTVPLSFRCEPDDVSGLHVSGKGTVQ